MLTVSESFLISESEGDTRSLDGWYALLRYGNGNERFASVEHLLRSPVYLLSMLERGLFPDAEAAEQIARSIKSRLASCRARMRYTDSAALSDTDIAALREIRKRLCAYLDGRTALV